MKVQAVPVVTVGVIGSGRGPPALSGNTSVEGVGAVTVIVTLDTCDTGGGTAMVMGTGWTGDVGAGVSAPPEAELSLGTGLESVAGFELGGGEAKSHGRGTIAAGMIL